MLVMMTGRKDQKEFTRGPLVKTPPSTAEGAGLIPGSVTKIPHATQPKDKNKIKKRSKLQKREKPRTP